MWKLGFRRLKNTVFAGKSRGATLIEVTIAVVVLGLLLASIPAAIVVSINTQHRQYETRVAESLSRSQLEYIKARDYVAGSGFPYGPRLDPIDNFVVTYWAEELQQGVQLITVSVYRSEVLDPERPPPAILETTNYKVDSSLEISGYEIPITTPGP